MFNITEELKKLPEKPGVYIMKDQNGEIIYVGKAIILKNRVRQYFQSLSNQSPKVRAMVERIAEFEYIITDSELEALILECNLIKKHKPKYNILLKDDKSYPYIKVTLQEEYPRVLMTRRLEKDGARYFGPFTSAFAVHETIDLLKKIFPIKTCSKVFPRDIGKSRPCLNFHIYQCLGPCQGNVNREDYLAVMKDICTFLSGHQEEIIKKLETQMKTASEELEFERAASIRDKINSLKHIAEKQKVLSTSMEDQDIVAFAKGDTDSCIQVFFIRSGKLIGREHFIFEGAGDAGDSELLSSFLKQFYSAAAFVPGEIVLQEDFDELRIIESWLSNKKQSKVHIRVPRKGEKLRMLEMVSANAEIALQQFKDKLKNQEAASREGLGGLKEMLGLEILPARIEAYDISNTGTSENVASMVVFENGFPSNKDYRRFKIRSVAGQNDYASMQEAVYRRFCHAKRELEDGQFDGKFTQMPDLILVDGGVGHVNAIKEVLRDVSQEIPIFGMVKDDRHRTRGLTSSETEYDLSKNLHVFRLVSAIQDEAHRFAVEYNKKLRNKRYTRSILDDIEGIGPKKKKLLLKHFGSISRMKKAELDDLMAVEGINRSLAEKIFDFLRQ